MAELKNNIDKFFSDLSSGTTWNVGVSIARKNAFPLDNTSVFKSYNELTTYAANGMSYMGQPVAVVNEDGSVDFYVLDANKVPQEVGKATVGDDKSITLDNGVLKLFGFDSAPDGAQLSKSGDKLVWALPDTTTAEGQSAAIAALQAIVNGVAANPETGTEAVDGLVQKVAKNTTDIKANTDAIAILNGAATVEGSVAYQIAQIVENSDNNSVDTLKEIAAWIADHPESVAEINKDIKANADAIAALERLVGSTEVATQITNAIAAALKIDGLDKYALASDLTALAGRVATAEGKIKTIEDALTADPLHSHSNKSELDKIVTDDVSKWNTAASDIATLKSNVESNPLHTHGNKSVLDGITSEKVRAWDSAKENAETYTETYAATKAQGQLADSALQSVSILGQTLEKNVKTSISVDEAKTALGIGTAAGLDASTLATKDDLATIKGGSTSTIKDVYDLAASKITAAEVDTKIASAGHASASDLSVHTENSEIHVTAALKTKWNAAADLVDTLTGGQAGGITNTINEAITSHKEESEARYDAKYATKTDVAADIKTAKEALEASIAETDVDVAENTAAIATINETIADHDTDISKAKSDITALQAAAETHALKTYVDTEVAKKADKTAYEATAATVSELKATVDGFFKEDAAIEGAIDTLKEIAAYIESDKTGATEITSKVGALETKVDVEKVSTAISSAVGSEEARALEAEGDLSARIDNLEQNKAGYATTSYVDSKASAAQTAAEGFATTKVNELAAGAVKANTDNISTNTTNIATNTADIADLKEDKADKATTLAGYAIGDAYTKSEVEALIAAATPEWGTF